MFNLLSLFKIRKLVKAVYKDGIMSLHYSDESIKQYKGECTVWYSYPMMKRLTTSGELYLCDIWSYIKEHGNDYPTAHKKVLNENK